MTHRTGNRESVISQERALIAVEAELAQARARIKELEIENANLFHTKNFQDLLQAGQPSAFVPRDVADGLAEGLDGLLHYCDNPSETAETAWEFAVGKAHEALTAYRAATKGETTQPVPQQP